MGGPDPITNKWMSDGYHQFVLQDQAAQAAQMAHRQTPPTKKFEIPKSDKSKKDVKKQKEEAKKQNKGFIK